MIRLTVKDDYRKSEFYFKSMKECEEFKYVFKNHWCNIVWNSPEEIPDNTPLSEYWQEHINDDPKELADLNLSWGFSLVRDFGHDELLPEQKRVVQMIMDGKVDQLVKEME